MDKRVSAAILALVMACSFGCHTMQFEVGSGPVSEVVRERKSYFMWGLVPTRRIDVGKHCPNGAVFIREETTFVDGLFNLVTLGIWTPRSSWYHCAQGEIQ